MASEQINIPEEHLEDFMQIIEWGLEQNEYNKLEGGDNVHPEVVEALTKWVKEMREYLNDSIHGDECDCEDCVDERKIPENPGDIPGVMFAGTLDQFLDEMES